MNIPDFSHFAMTTTEENYDIIDNALTKLFSVVDWDCHYRFSIDIYTPRYRYRNDGKILIRLTYYGTTPGPIHRYINNKWVEFPEKL